MLPKLIKTEKDKSKVESLLESFYRKPSENYVLGCGQNIYDSYANFIYKNLKPNSKILDMGSGITRLPATIAKKGFRVFSCDFFLKETFSQNEHLNTKNSFYLVCGTGLSLPFKDESFDAVTSLCVLEHIISVDKFLQENNRVLKRGGTLIIQSPNWSGLNAPLKAIGSLIINKSQSYWQYDNLLDAFLGIFRSLIWYFNIFFTKKDKFILVFPRIKNDQVYFNKSDDDCVHICQPLSFKKWFKKHNFKILKYNRFEGRTTIAKIFNTLFPSFATTNNIVAIKQ